MPSTKIYGAPGTGKTTRMLELLSREIESGTPVERIAFVTHTVSARREAIDRITKSVSEQELKYFRTIHGICYAQIGLHRSQVMQTSDYLAFGAAASLPFSSHFSSTVDADGIPEGYQHSPGNELLAIRQLAAAKCCSITDLTQEWPKDISTEMMRKALDKYRDWKAKESKFDFVDMLVYYARHGEPLDVDVVFLDEGQDLSRQQWLIFAIMARNAKRIYVAGDDDQSIYSFIGADPYGFLDYGTDASEVLPKTWRLRDNIWHFAQKIIRRVSKRQDKIISTFGQGGMIDYYNTDIRHIDIDPNETTMLISPHNNQLADFAEELDSRGIPYGGRGWTPNGSSNATAVLAFLALRAGEDIQPRAAATMLDKIGLRDKAREYRNKARTSSTTVNKIEGVNLEADWVSYLSRSDRDKERNRVIKGILKNVGIKGVTEPPKVSMTTFHGSKGREADHVILMTDCYRKAYDNARINPDDERRLAYVGVTRAKNRLSIILPQTEMYMRSLV